MIPYYFLSYIQIYARVDKDRDKDKGLDESTRRRRDSKYNDDGGLMSRLGSHAVNDGGKWAGLVG